MTAKISRKPPAPISAPPTVGPSAGAANSMIPAVTEMDRARPPLPSSMDIGLCRAGVRRRAAVYAVRATRQLDSAARDRALAAARNLTVFFPERKVRAVIRAAAEQNPAR